MRDLPLTRRDAGARLPARLLAPRAGALGRALLGADHAVYRLVRGRATDTRVVTSVRAFSHLGEHAACWLALGAAGVALDRPRRARWRRALVGVAGAYGVNVAVKGVVARRRPSYPHLPALVATPTALSFPSSHATASFAAARAYAPLTGAAAPALTAVAVAMGASRVFLGVHYPSDVLAGAALGTALGSLAR